jgi:pimeloyl-ACP methyl ester carboxylesterase
MPMVQVGEVELFYELRRKGDEPVLMLVCGLSSQLISWDDELCEMFEKAGFGLLLFDNRDAGLSTSFAPATSLAPAQPAEPSRSSGFAFDPSTAAYTLADMAEDASGLLGALGIDRAHVVGVSMGGMIAQALAIAHPEQVESLCSIMSTTGATDVGTPTTEALRVLLAPSPTDRDRYIDRQVAIQAAIGSPGFPTDVERTKQRAGRAFDRRFRPDGVVRQVLAIVSSPDRTEALGHLSIPTLVIHGEDDALVAVSGGRATAAAMPGSRLITIPGMGHDLPKEIWPRVVNEISRNAGVGASR